MIVMTPFALTIGEPAGIGPDIILQLAAKKPELFSAEKIIVIGNKKLLRDRASILNLPYNGLSILDIPLNAPCVPGQCDTRNASFVMSMLKIAAEKALKKEVSGIITAPIHKAILNDAGFSITGHTDFFSTVTNTKTVMMLMTRDLKIALYSDHMPLRQVPEYLTKQQLSDCLHIILNDFQKRFDIEKPRILVCGLNPHAGENGYLGSEEKEIMIPVITDFQQQGHRIIGPIGADVAFTSHYRENVDVVLAMYHDQGLPVIKYAGFHDAVNVTLGLPFIRTSVDHGTALDIAGTGKADTNSLHQAILIAKEQRIS